MGTAVYNRSKDAKAATGDWLGELVKPDPWYKDVVPDFRNLTKDELPPGHETGNTFTSVCINTAIYLPWLTSECLKAGVVFQRQILNHISDAANVHHSGKKADVVVNCTGLSAGKLGGVMDEKITPARGQTVLVRNEADVMASNSGTDDGDDEVCYIMQRAAGKFLKNRNRQSKPLKQARWRDAFRRFLPKRQLGFPGRPYLSE
ncbi:MAG: hypothetical protein Q9195_001496 [Heterodermia aff. obscurata]